MLGWLYQYGEGGVAQDEAQALALYRLAAAQNLDVAQNALGYMYEQGDILDEDDAEDYAESLRLFQLAAAQGNPVAMCNVAHLHELGLGVPENQAEAIRWYRRAQAAGQPEASDALRRLRA